MIEILPEYPDNVLAVSAIGAVTDEDYKTVLIPAAEAKMRKHDKIRVLYHLGPRFEKFQARAMVDDAAFGLRNLRHFERIAVVTDTEWLRTAVRMMGFLMPCPVRVFPDNAMRDAESWIKQASPP